MKTRLRHAKTTYNHRPRIEAQKALEYPKTSINLSRDTTLPNLQNGRSNQNLCPHLRVPFPRTLKGNLSTLSHFIFPN